MSVRSQLSFLGILLLTGISQAQVEVKTVLADIKASGGVTLAPDGSSGDQ